EINRNLIESKFGYHIIMRTPYTTIKTDYDPVFPRIVQNVADSTLTENLLKNADIQVKANAPVTIKEALKNPGANKKNRTVVATFKGGDMNMGEMLGWIDVMPGQTRGQILQFVPTWPDTQVTAFTK